MNYRTVLLIIFVILCAHTSFAQQPFTFVKTDEPVSLWKALAWDVLPGGGHMYTGHYEYAAVFAGLKISGVYAMYYYYNYWQYRGSLYRSAKKANEAIDPEHDLLFKDPEGGYKTVKEFGYAYDRAAHYFTLSILANAAIYITSWLCTWYHVQEINESRQPTYVGFNQFSFTTDENGTMWASCTMRW
ncbi:MAG: hypothetical protein QHH74_11345 [Spirochaetota bacterium]|nr:hypothetical protein [Spirochaetota bacterium]